MSYKSNHIIRHTVRPGQELLLLAFISENKVQYRLWAISGVEPGRQLSKALQLKFPSCTFLHRWFRFNWYRNITFIHLNPNKGIFVF